MPFHSHEDFDTIFDSSLGGGYDAVISPPAGDDYPSTAIRSKDVEKVDEFGNISEKITILHFLRSVLPGALDRGTTVTLDGMTYTIESLVQETTYIRSYEAS